MDYLILSQILDFTGESHFAPPKEWGKFRLLFSGAPIFFTKIIKGLIIKPCLDLMYINPFLRAQFYDLLFIIYFRRATSPADMPNA